MKFSVVLFAGFLLAAPALADELAGADTIDKEPCLNPSSSYSVRWLEGHDLLARNTLGKGHKPVRISTSCIGLSDTYFYAFEAVSRCLGKGDLVFATNIDGRRERCVVTGVAFYVAPAPEAKPQ